MNRNFLTGQKLPPVRGQNLPPATLQRAALQGVKFTPRMAFCRGQILPAINNSHYVQVISGTQPDRMSDPLGAVRVGRGVSV